MHALPAFIFFVLLLISSMMALGSPLRSGFETLPHAVTNVDDAAYQFDTSFDMDFFGTTYGDLYVGTNGILTFGAGNSAYTSVAFPISSIPPVIAAFWADVDLRPGGSGDENTLFYGETVIDGRTAFVATWHEVRAYWQDASNGVNTFQAVLFDRSDIEAGAFDIEFNYQAINWLSGAVSGGVNPQIGFDAGNGEDFLAIPGSRTAAMADLESMSNIGMPGRFVFEVRNGVVSNGLETAAVPTPAAAALILTGLAGAALSRRAG